MHNIFSFLLENWYFSALFFVILIIYLVIEFRLGGSGSKRLSPALAALQMNRKNTVVIDIRSKAAFDAGHITGSHHCPLPSLGQLSQTPGISPTQRKNLTSSTIILVDEHGAKSPKAAKKLKAEGYTAIMILNGGLESWKQEKLPLIKSRVAAESHSSAKNDEDPSFSKPKPKSKKGKSKPKHPKE